jgi:hypothetical protein
LNECLFVVKISGNSDLSSDTIVSLFCYSERVLVKVSCRIVKFLLADYLIVVKVKLGNERAPIGIVRGSVRLVLILIDVARAVVVTLIEDIHGVVSPLVIFIVIVVKLILKLIHGLFDWLVRLNRLRRIGRLGRGSRPGRSSSGKAKN